MLPLHAGRSQRRKTNHFAVYDETAKKSTKLIGIDLWMINLYFIKCSGPDFHERIGERELAHAVKMVLRKAVRKHKEYGMTETLYVVIKTDASAYDIGVMTVRDLSEVKGLDWKERNKVSVVKGGLEISGMIMQGGMYTPEGINEAMTGPVVYMINRYMAGGFYRIHTGRGVDENLNAPGMHFAPLPFMSNSLSGSHIKPGAGKSDHFCTHGVVARLALSAAPLELEKIDPNSLV